MKKITSLLLIIAGIFMITGCKVENVVVEENSDSLLIKEEYESLNGTIREKDGKTISTISLSDENPFVYTTADEIISKIDNGDTFMLYFGFADCPWCRNAITVLSDAAKSAGVKKVYYFNLKDKNKEDVRNVLMLDENENIIITKEGSSDYNKLLDKLESSLDAYSGLNDETIKRIYAPTVLFIQDGNVIGKHVGTVDSQKDPYVLLDEEQTKELNDIYTDYIHEMLDDLCDEKC